ncbi:MAG: N-6 DNA methylase [Lachnospiraceae bacterium]|nr:N-6 DNA methylase [Lachnospiraceae bacterium]
MAYRTEDEVRNAAGGILGFTITDHNGCVINVENIDVISGVGQLTTFIELGKRLKITEFKGICDKPDGWYFPKDNGKPAIILETKSEKEDIFLEKWESEIQKNIDIVLQRYLKVIGILYNGKDIRVFKNKTELTGIAPDLQSKDYYISIYTENRINKQHIYEVTQKINNSLHFKFGMQDLQDRMIFTACALVAQRYNPTNGLEKLKGMGYSTFHNWIYNALAKAIENDKKQNDKLDVLLQEYSTVRMAITEDQTAINSFIDNVCEIAELVNSDYWNGEDVMAIFFNEFNRYRGKADAGQVFTPDHVTSFMYRLIDVDVNDRVLDGTCGSGAFLVKAMCNMIKAAGGMNTSKAAIIMSEQLFGIEMYRKVFALACANMMIHKDGKTNLAQLDAKSDEAADWIHNKKITKVLMNPPYERKYGCMKIVENILDNVPANTKCAIIMPDKKLEKDNGKKLLKKHTLTTIIKMPENLFFGIGITTSVFVFETGKPQNNRNIIGYYIEDDGLETVKNQGRQDIKNRWDAIEEYWINAIRDGNDSMYNTRQIINPNEHLSYQMPEKPFEIYEEDFVRTIMDYEMFKQGISSKEFEDKLLQKVLYGSKVIPYGENTAIIVKGGSK